MIRLMKMLMMMNNMKLNSVIKIKNDETPEMMEVMKIMNVINMYKNMKVEI